MSLHVFIWYLGDERWKSKKKKKISYFFKIEFIYCKRISNPILLYVILNMPCLRSFMFLFVHFALLCDRLTPITGLTWSSCTTSLPTSSCNYRHVSHIQHLVLVYIFLITNDAEQSHLVFTCGFSLGMWYLLPFM